MSPSLVWCCFGYSSGEGCRTGAGSLVEEYGQGQPMTCQRGSCAPADTSHYSNTTRSEGGIRGTPRGLAERPVSWGTEQVRGGWRGNPEGPVLKIQHPKVRFCLFMVVPGSLLWSSRSYFIVFKSQRSVILIHFQSTSYIWQPSPGSGVLCWGSQPVPFFSSLGFQSFFLSLWSLQYHHQLAHYWLVRFPFLPGCQEATDNSS